MMSSPLFERGYHRSPASQLNKRIPGSYAAGNQARRSSSVVVAPAPAPSAADGAAGLAHPVGAIAVAAVALGIRSRDAVAIADAVVDATFAVIVVVAAQVAAILVAAAAVAVVVGTVVAPAPRLGGTRQGEKSGTTHEAKAEAVHVRLLARAPEAGDVRQRSRRRFIPGPRAERSSPKR
jgi:hypothetical protein